MLDDRRSLASYFDNPDANRSWHDQTEPDHGRGLRGNRLDDYKWDSHTETWVYTQDKTHPVAIPPDGKQWHHHGQKWKKGEYGYDQENRYMDEQKFFRDASNIPADQAARGVHVHVKGTPWTPMDFGYVEGKSEEVAARKAKEKAEKQQREAAKAAWKLKSKALGLSVAENHKAALAIFMRHRDWGPDVHDFMTTIENKLSELKAEKNRILEQIEASHPYPAGANDQQKALVNKTRNLQFYSHTTTFRYDAWQQSYAQIVVPYLTHFGVMDRIQNQIPAPAVPDSQTYYLTVFIKYVTSVKHQIMSTATHMISRLPSRDADQQAFLDHSHAAKKELDELDHHKKHYKKVPAWRPDAIAMNMWNEFIARGMYEEWASLHRDKNADITKVPKKYQKFHPAYVAPPPPKPEGTGKNAKKKAKKKGKGPSTTPRTAPSAPRPPKLNPDGTRKTKKGKGRGGGVPPPPPMEGYRGYMQGYNYNGYSRR